MKKIKIERNLRIDGERRKNNVENLIRINRYQNLGNGNDDNAFWGAAYYDWRESNQ